MNEAENGLVCLSLFNEEQIGDIISVVRQYGSGLAIEIEARRQRAELPPQVMSIAAMPQMDSADRKNMVWWIATMLFATMNNQLANRDVASKLSFYVATFKAAFAVTDTVANTFAKKVDVQDSNFIEGVENFLGRAWNFVFQGNSRAAKPEQTDLVDADYMFEWAQAGAQAQILTKRAAYVLYTIGQVRAKRLAGAGDPVAVNAAGQELIPQFNAAINARQLGLTGGFLDGLLAAAQGAASLIPGIGPMISTGIGALGKLIPAGQAATPSAAVAAPIVGAKAAANAPASGSKGSSIEVTTPGGAVTRIY